MPARLGLLWGIVMMLGEGLLDSFWTALNHDPTWEIFKLGTLQVGDDDDEGVFIIAPSDIAGLLSSGPGDCFLITRHLDGCFFQFLLEVFFRYSFYTSFILACYSCILFLCFLLLLYRSSILPPSHFSLSQHLFQAMKVLQTNRPLLREDI